MKRRTHLLLLAAALNVAPLPSAAAVISAEDVSVERQTINESIAREKAATVAFMRSAGRTELMQRACIGISRIENKLSLTESVKQTEEPESQAKLLGDQQFSFGASIEARTYSGHYPTNKLACYVDVQGRKKPEIYIPPQELKTGVVVMVPTKPLDVPTCLRPEEIEDYIHMRIDHGLKPGDYWAQLHRGRLTLDELARLRVYDHLDLRAPHQPVLVFRCTEIRSRNH